MKKRHDPRQLDLLDWTPPTADIVKHPAIYRAIWAGKVAKCAGQVIADGGAWQRLPVLLAKDLVRAGASESETSRQVKAFMAALAQEVARQRGAKRQGPGAA